MKRFLTFDERKAIEEGLRKGVGFTAIAKQLQRDVSTISYEYYRNKNENGSYSAEKANEYVKQRSARLFGLRNTKEI